MILELVPTGSQSDWGWKASLGIIQSHPHSEQHQLKQLLRAKVRSWISPRMETPQPLCNLFKSLTTLTEKKIVIFKWNFLCFDFCSLLLVLSLGITEKSLALSLLPPVRYLSFSVISVSSCERCSNPLIVFMAFCWSPCLFCAAELRSGSWERPGESKKVEEERLSSKAKGKTVLLILDVTCKPLSQLTESSLPPSCTQSPSIFFFVAI